MFSSQRCAAIAGFDAVAVVVTFLRNERANPTFFYLYHSIISTIYISHNRTGPAPVMENGKQSKWREPNKRRKKTHTKTIATTTTTHIKSSSQIT